MRRSFPAALVLIASLLSCGPLRQEDLDEGAISVGEDYDSARERLLSAGAFEITNLVHFYGGHSLNSLSRTKEGKVLVSADLVHYTRNPSQETRSWFILPDATCVSIYVQAGNGSHITSIELGARGKGFLPPEEALKPEHLSAAVEPDPALDGIPVEVLPEDVNIGAPLGPLWAGQTRTSVARLRLDEYSAPGARGGTLAKGMPHRQAVEILAAHGAEDLTDGVALFPTAVYERGKLPATLPCQQVYVLPGESLVILEGRYDPRANEQFIVEDVLLGKPGVGYPGAHNLMDASLTHPERLDVEALVRRVGPAHYAARIGDRTALQKLLQERSGVARERDPQGATPLHLAVKFGRREAARMLLDAGADANAADAKGDTPLHLAARSGRPDLAVLLLDHGADASFRNRGGRSPFLALGGSGDAALVTRILDRQKVDVNQADENGFTLLHRAAIEANPDLARVLLQHGANPKAQRSEGITPLYEAISSNAVAVARLLLEAGAPVHPVFEDKWRPLDAVAQSGSIEIARLLLDRGLKPDGPALYEAANNGHGPMVKLFLEHGADLQYREEPWKRTALHTANSAEVVKVLVQAGMDIEVKNDSGETPLHEAAHFAPHEVVVALLALGADPHALSQSKQTPLQVAEERDRPEKEAILSTLRAAMKATKPRPPTDRK